MNVKNHFQKINWIFVLGLFLTGILLWPMFVAPYFSHHDDVQVIRLDQINKCFEDNQIPCRWVPDLGGLYGYPLFNYYAPLPYYFGEIFYKLSSNFIFSAKVMFATSLLGGYIFMFLFGKKLWGNVGGFISGIFYSYAPYHAVDLYVRGAIGELWALMFFPAIFWSLIRLKEKVSIINTLLISMFTAFLILSHNISAMIFLPTAGIFVLIFSYVEHNYKMIQAFVIAVFLAVGLASFYFLPVIFEKNLVHVDSTTWGYFHYTEHFKGVRKTILDRSWGWGASIREVPGGEKDGMSFQIGWVHVISAVISLIISKLLWKKKRSTSILILFFISMSAISIFMIHPRSEFIWKLIPTLEYLQFPWRFLTLVIFFISAMSGAIVLTFHNTKMIAATFLLVVLVILLNIKYFMPETLKYVTDEQLLTGKSLDTLIKRSIFDYLPIYAKAPPAELATRSLEILSGNPVIKNYQKGTNWIKFNIKTTELTAIRLSQYYFPGWVVKVGDKEVVINYNNELGLITFMVDPGEYQVGAQLYDTPVRTLGNRITMLSIGIFLGLGLLTISRIKKFLKYLISGFNS